MLDFLNLTPEQIQTLWGMMPEDWTAFLGGLFTFLIAVRTFLRAFVFFLRFIDYSLDKHYDWTWVGEFSDKLDWVDGKFFDRLPVKAIGVKSRKLP